MYKDDPIPTQMARSPTIRKLYERPRLYDEVEASPVARQYLVAKLKPPMGNAQGSTGSYDGLSKARTVYYLYGDDRRAVRRFIHENETFVASVFNRGGAPDILTEAWDEFLVELLREEWQLYREYCEDD